MTVFLYTNNYKWHLAMYLYEAEATFRKKCYFLEFSLDMRPYNKCRFLLILTIEVKLQFLKYDYIKTLLKKECKTYTGGK